MHQILGENVESGQDKLVRFQPDSGSRQNLEHICTHSAILSGRVQFRRCTFSQQSVVPPLKLGLAEFELYGGQFAAAGQEQGNFRFRKQALGNESQCARSHPSRVKHLFDQPPRSKYLPVIGNAPLGLDQAHS